MPAFRHGLEKLTDEIVPGFAVDKGVEGWTHGGRFPSRQRSTEKLETETFEDDRLEVVRTLEHDFECIRCPRGGIHITQVELSKIERSEEVYPWHMVDLDGPIQYR